MFPLKWQLLTVPISFEDMQVCHISVKFHCNIVNKIHDVHTELAMDAETFKGFISGKRNLKMPWGRARREVKSSLFVVCTEVPFMTLIFKKKWVKNKTWKPLTGRSSICWVLCQVGGLVLTTDIKASLCPLRVHSPMETQVSEGHIWESQSPHLYNGDKSPCLPWRCAVRLKRDHVCESAFWYCQVHTLVNWYCYIPSEVPREIFAGEHMKFISFNFSFKHI